MISKTVSSCIVYLENSPYSAYSTYFLDSVGRGKRAWSRVRALLVTPLFLVPLARPSILDSESASWITVTQGQVTYLKGCVIFIYRYDNFFKCTYLESVKYNHNFITKI